MFCGAMLLEATKYRYLYDEWVLKYRLACFSLELQSIHGDVPI